MAAIEFIFETVKTVIPCNINDKLKDIINKFINKTEKDINSLYIIYNSKTLTKELTESTFFQIANSIDKERKKMVLLVYKINSENERNRMIKSKDIICPKCGENIRININNYKINLIRM